MTATTSGKLGASPPFTPVVASQTATGPPGGATSVCETARTGPRPALWPMVVEIALAHVQRTVSGPIRWISDELARRQTMRELRRMDRFRLADVGVDPAEIERVVDAMLAARRDAVAGRGREGDEPAVRVIRGRSQWRAPPCQS